MTRTARRLAVIGVVAGITGSLIGIAPSLGASEHEPSDGGGPDPGMARMHELMVTKNPGMARMHELMVSENPGMARMHELMMEGTP